MIFLKGIAYCSWGFFLCDNIILLLATAIGQSNNISPVLHTCTVCAYFPRRRVCLTDEVDYCSSETLQFIKTMVFPIARYYTCSILYSVPYIAVYYPTIITVDNFRGDNFCKKSEKALGSNCCDNIIIFCSLIIYWGTFSDTFMFYHVYNYVSL